MMKTKMEHTLTIEKYTGWRWWDWYFDCEELKNVLNEWRKIVDIRENEYDWNDWLIKEIKFYFTK